MTTQLPSSDLDRMLTLYRSRFARYGANPESLGWTKGKQDVRFDVILDELNCDDRTFLDVGCGFGDLNRAIRRRSTRYYYHGLDIVPEFIDQARARYGSSDVTFNTGEISSITSGANSYDYVVACGAFSYRLEGVDNGRYVEEALARMFQICRVAVVVDFLSDRVTFRRDHCFHCNPETALSIALKLSRSVRLRHDYMPFEFLVTIFKDDSFDEKDTLFHRYKNEASNH